MLGASEARLGIARKSASSVMTARWFVAACAVAARKTISKTVRRLMTPHHNRANGGRALGYLRRRPCRLVPPVVMPLRVVIAKRLHAFTQQAADDRPFERLVMIDGRTGNRSDHGAAGLAVVMTIRLGAIVTIVMRLRERASGRQKEREAQQCRL